MPISMSLTFKIQMVREPIELPNCRMEFNEEIAGLEDLQTWVTKDDFNLVGYKHHESIKYEFIV